MAAVTRNEPATKSDKPPAVTDPRYEAPDLYVGRERDIFEELLHWFIIPSAVVIAIVLILMFVMCCRRTGMKKRLKTTSRADMEHYESVKQASMFLRQLDHERDIPLSPQCLVSATLREDLSPTSSRRQKAKSAPGTLLRAKDESTSSPPLQPTYATADRSRIHSKVLEKHAMPSSQRADA